MAQLDTCTPTLIGLVVARYFSESASLQARHSRQ
jgi:hypothetical protein